MKRPLSRQDQDALVNLGCALFLVIAVVVVVTLTYFGVIPARPPH